MDFIKYKRTVFNDLKKTYQKAIAKDVETEKMLMQNVLTHLPNVKILDKKQIFLLTTNKMVSM